MKLDDNIYYTSNQGTGSALIFIHGNSLSSKSFEKQLNSPILRKFNITAIDLPGHGNSMRADNPSREYSVSSLAQAVVEFISSKFHESVILVGHSLGGHVAIEVAAQLKILKGLVFFGTPPVSSPIDIPNGFLPTESFSYAFQDNLNEYKLNKMCRLNLGDSFEYDNMLKNDILNTDKSFRGCLGTSVGKGEFADEIMIVNELKIPVAVFHGELDQVVNIDYIKKLDIPNLWKSEIQIIKNSPHLSHYVNPNEFNTLLNKFIIEECT